MEIPLNKDVFCGENLCGRSTRLLINPIDEQVTHLVVAGKDFPNTERMVPVQDIVETTNDWIRLRLDQAEFEKLEMFIETNYIDSGRFDYIMPFDEPYMFLPYSTYEIAPIPIERKHIPAGEVAIHRGTVVYATDGKIGKVDEFLINPTNDDISHLILREGHLWEPKDVVIPVEDIDKITDNGVYLKRDKKYVGSLSAIPIKRKWR
jgi:sporulation protein YlmC with PRC-barrel domain